MLRALQQICSSIYMNLKHEVLEPRHLSFTWYGLLPSNCHLSLFEGWGRGEAVSEKP